jgi:hypothetical protein
MIYRARSRFQPGTEKWDLILLAVLFPAIVIEIPFATLDAGRMGWSDVPLWVVLIGYGLLIGGIAGACPSDSRREGSSASIMARSETLMRSTTSPFRRRPRARRWRRASGDWCTMPHRRRPKKRKENVTHVTEVTDPPYRAYNGYHPLTHPPYKPLLSVTSVTRHTRPDTKIVAGFLAHAYRDATVSW